MKVCVKAGDIRMRSRLGCVMTTASQFPVAMRELGVTAQEAVYVGDSDVDVETARNAGLPCVAVLWGFRDEACLHAAGAVHLVRTPHELLETVERL